MKGNTIMITRTYVKELVVSDVPTLEDLENTYKAYQPENKKDAFVTYLLHRKALRWLRSGFINKPGIYKISMTVKFPIMFWHKIHYRIERL
jgi:hypothetical protein